MYIEKSPLTNVNLVPDTVNTSPDYFCSWQVQLYHCNNAGPQGQRDCLTEDVIFGSGDEAADRKVGSGWANHLYKDARRDLIFVMDDCWDVPVGGLKDKDPWYGSQILAKSKFPSFVKDGVSNQDAMKALARSDIPTVLVNIEDASLAARERNVSAVWLDNGDIGRVGAEHLLAQGEFKSFAFVHKNTREFFSRERESAFRSTLANRGIASSAFDPDTNDAKALAAWLKALPKPAAVMAATDERAVECLRACRAAKIEVPNQIAILGVGDDMSRSKLLPVPLSSVRPNYAQAGFLAMQELDRLYAMRGRRKYQEIVVPADGVSLRDSTKPALSASHLVRNALAFIEQNADRDLTPQMVTSHLGKSRRLVELRFGEICRKTVRMAIEDCRLAKACPRLRQTDGNVRQVAAELQFRSANALTRIFKRHFGMTITTWLHEDRKRG